MGWAGPFELSDGRLVGYAVEAPCDASGCTTPIDRGLGYLCGSMHGEDEDGCTFYFCEDHRDPTCHDCPNIAAPAQEGK